MFRNGAILFCLFFLVVISSVDALVLKKSISSTNIIPKKAKPLKVIWKEQGNQILHDSVCYNYPEGDINYRQCREQARQLFRDRCTKFEGLYKQTKYPYDKEYKRKMEKYCRSASIFWP